MPAPCHTCRHGCGCNLTDPACGHYGCYGRGPVTCPGATREESRYAAALALQRAEHARTLTRRARHLAGLRAAALAARGILFW